MVLVTAISLVVWFAIASAVLGLCMAAAAGDAALVAQARRQGRFVHPRRRRPVPRRRTHAG